MSPGAGLEQNLLDAAREEENRHFIAAWRGWRGQRRLLPRRSDIDLNDIKHLLGRVILLELRGEDDILVRVAGSQLREHGDFEATGKNLRDLTLSDQWPVRRWRMGPDGHASRGPRRKSIPWMDASALGGSSNRLAQFRYSA